MREWLIVGKPNSGKTMFVLNFAKYLGTKNLELTVQTSDRQTRCRKYDIEDAKKELCSPLIHKTRSLQSVIIKTSVGKASVNFKLNDSCGVSEEIHDDEYIRKGMAQTINLLRHSDFIIHIIDLSKFTEEYSKNKYTIDHEFYNIGILRNSYIMLANKIDIPQAKENLIHLIRAFPGTRIAPISALLSQGFGEVKTRVSRSI